MHAVLGLLKDFICVSLEYIRCDFLSAVRRQAVEHHTTLVCYGHKLLVYLIALKRRLADFLLLFLSHGRPNVGENNVGVLCRLFGVSYDFKLIAKALAELEKQIAKREAELERREREQQDLIVLGRRAKAQQLADGLVTDKSDRSITVRKLPNL